MYSMNKGVYSVLILNESVVTRYCQSPSPAEQKVQSLQLSNSSNLDWGSDKVIFYYI